MEEKMCEEETYPDIDYCCADESLDEPLIEDPDLTFPEDEEEEGEDLTTQDDTSSEDPEINPDSIWNSYFMYNAVPFHEHPYPFPLVALPHYDNFDPIPHVGDPDPAFITHKNSRMDTRDILSFPEYMGFHLFYDPYYCNQYFISILRVLICDIVDILIGRARTFVCRMDLRQPVDYTGTDGHVLMSRAIRDFKRHLEYKYRRYCNNPDIRIYRATEQAENTAHTHDHLLILANGHVFQTTKELHGTLTRYMQKVFHTDNKGLVHLCTNPIYSPYGSYMVHNPSGVRDYLIKYTIYIASYLAKVNTKENLPAGVRKFSYTRSSTIK